jgi:hypothetical protein
VLQEHGSYEVASSLECSIICVRPLNLVDRLSSGRSQLMQDEEFYIILWGDYSIFSRGCLVMSFDLNTFLIWSRYENWTSIPSSVRDIFQFTLLVIVCASKINNHH